MNPILSIIIPCYNSEETLRSTLDSVLQQQFQDWEAIVVNDGSPDNLESIALEFVEMDSRFIYFKKQNEGLGSTRNFGIKKAKGKFILPLDSDNQVEKNFALDAMSAFESNSRIGVVHGHAEYYGEKSGIWKVEDYNLDSILLHNYIDACAIYKKSLWEEVGGYDDNMPYQGLEDWEFWIALGSLNVAFHHLHKITFKYFVSESSMIRSYSDKMRQSNIDYIMKKHKKQYYEYYKELYLMYINKENEFSEKLKSEKFVIDLFCSTFFKFSIFGLYKNKK